MKGRRRLSFGGHIVVSVCVNGGGHVIAGPEFVMEGLPDVEEDDESLGDVVKRSVSGTLKSIPPKRRSDTELVQTALTRAIRSEVGSYWGRKPNVTVFVHRV